MPVRAYRYILIAGFGLSLAACVSGDTLPPAPRTVDMSGSAPQTGPVSGGEQTTRPPIATPHRKTGKPYKVAGVWYYPEDDPDYNKTGIGSWYGPKFHGKKTANGEVFDMNRLTAAHPTLPLPSLLRVTNLQNNKQVVVRLNDRGPFADSRLIDLSREAAEQLGYKDDGLAELRVEYLGEASLSEAITAVGQPQAFADGTYATPQKGVYWGNEDKDTVRTRIISGPEIALSHSISPAEKLNQELLQESRLAVAKTEELVTEVPVIQEHPVEMQTTALDKSPVVINTEPVTNRVSSFSSDMTTDSGVKYLVQVAAFASTENLDKAVALFENDYPIRQQRIERNDDFLYRVRLGPFASRSAVDKALEFAHNKGFNDARIVVID
ncbi:MAG: septal ring lytic transglycosylase RlpA family protein [bacterium]